MSAKGPSAAYLAAILFSLMLTGCASLQPDPTPTLTSTPVPPTQTPTVSPSPTPAPTLTPTDEPTPEPTEVAFPDDIPCFVLFSQFAVAGVDIFVADCTGEELNVSQLTEHAGAAVWPKLSPNLLTIAYIFYDPVLNQDNFWAIDFSTEGTPYRQVTSGGISASEYFWSPDSRYIVYSGPQADGSEMDIYRIEISTGAIRNLTAGSLVWDAHPQWSPVDDLIVFVSDRAPQGKNSDNLWLMNGNGGNLRQLTNTETWEDTFPSWSPDGKAIAFFRMGVLGDESEAKPGLVILDVESGQEWVLVKEAGFLNQSAPVWSPDGQYLAYQEIALVESGAIYVVPAAGGEPVQIIDLPGENYGISWSIDSHGLSSPIRQTEISNCISSIETVLASVRCFRVTEMRLVRGSIPPSIDRHGLS